MKELMVSEGKKVNLDFYFKGFAQLIEKVESADFSDHLFDFMKPIFDVQNLILLIIDKDIEPICVSSYIPQASLKKLFDEDYFKFGYLLDPFYELIKESFEDGAYSIKDIAPDRFFSQSEYYQRYFNKTRIIDEMSCVGRIDDHKSVHLSLGRYLNCAKFKKKELALLQSLCSLLIPLLVKHSVFILSRQDSDSTRPHVSLKQQLYQANFPKDKRITLREAEVASMIIKGYSTVAIGLKLFISPQTVKVHRRNIYKKLNISSQAELFTFFVKGL